MKKKQDIPPPVIIPEQPGPWKITFNWLIFAVVIAAIVLAFRYIHLPELHLKHYELIILAFSGAFVWVYVLRWGSVRPFNCITCLCGWFSLILGCWQIGWQGIIYMPVGMTFAALYSEIRSRWL